MSIEDIAREYWSAMSAGAWERLAALLDYSFEAGWPQSGMRFRGRDAFVSMNRAYPGSGTIELVRVAAIGADEVVTETYLHWEIAGAAAERIFAVSFLTISGTKITSAREYWANCHEPPGWQLRYGDRIAKASLTD